MHGLLYHGLAFVITWNRLYQDWK